MDEFFSFWSGLECMGEFVLRRGKDLSNRHQT
jgi:hypothetical protein